MMRSNIARMARSQRSAFPLLVAAALSLLLINRTKAVEPIGDEAELFVTGVASAAYNDNIFLAGSNAKADEIFDISPGLSYEFGKNHALTVGKLAAFEDFQFFGSHSKLNNQFFNAATNVTYDDQKDKVTFDGSFYQTDQAQRDISNNAFLVNRDVSHVDAADEVQLGDNKSSFSAGVVWDDTSYKRAGYVGLDTVSIPVNYYLKLEPKLDISAGFRYRNSNLGVGGIDSQDYYYNVGARGEFTPDLSGQFDIGYSQQQMKIGSNHNGLGADSTFTYTYSPATSFNFGANDDFGYDATGAAYRLLSPFVGYLTALDATWSFNARVSYGRYSYLIFAQSRQDNFYTAQAGITHIVNGYLIVSALYSHNENDSNLSAFNFKNNVFTISASLHY